MIELILETFNKKGLFGITNNKQFCCFLTTLYPNTASIKEALYRLLNNIIDIPTCKYCQKNTTKFKSFKDGYRDYCSYKCSNKVTALAQTRTDKIKETKKNRYGNENYNNYNKNKSTCLKKYGVDNPQKNLQIQNKTRATNLERYGVEYTWMSEGVKDKIKQTNLERYGVEIPNRNEMVRDKIKQTNLERYGVENVFSNEAIKEKIKNTNIEKYGVLNPQQNENIQNKTRQTNLSRYGFVNPSMSISVKRKIKETNIERYSRIHPNQSHLSDETIKKLQDVEWLTDEHHIRGKTLSQISKELNLPINASTLSRYFKKNNIQVKYLYSSQPEQEIFDYIKSLDLNMKILQRERGVLSDGTELDIYIPEKKIAIEFNGLYWHSFDCQETPRERNRHKIKTDLCEELGIQLIQIFENEWETNPDIIKSILASKLGYIKKIFARKCKIDEVSIEEARNFLNDNHIQGYCYAQVRLGLYYNEELIAIQTYKKGFHSKRYEWELSRFSSKCHIQVLGGASRLFNYFIKSYNPTNIITFADRRYSIGKLYETLGFKNDHVTKPNYFYLDPKSHNLIHRCRFQKKKLNVKLPIFDNNLSESENMFNNGFRRIWDCGNITFTWDKANAKP